MFLSWGYSPYRNSLPPLYITVFIMSCLHLFLSLCHEIAPLYISFEGGSLFLFISNLSLQIFPPRKTSCLFSHLLFLLFLFPLGHRLFRFNGNYLYCVFLLRDINLTPCCDKWPHTIKNTIAPLPVQLGCYNNKMN